MRFPRHRLILTAVAALGIGAAAVVPRWTRANPAPGGFEAASLAELIAASDAWTEGVIREVNVRSFDPGDGAPLYVTTLSIEGTTTGTGVASGPPLAPAAIPTGAGTVLVQFPGGFMDDEHGTFNSIAPARHETRVGRRVVAFHRHEPNAFSGGPGRVLVGGRAGLFTAFESRSGAVIVQGRPGSVAVPHNLGLGDFQRSVSAQGRTQDPIQVQTPGQGDRATPVKEDR